MGPQPSSRGNSRIMSIEALPAANSRFNGAATFQSRKSRRTDSPPLLWKRFNGAATFQSRKFESGAQANVNADWASMGPQPSSRGN